MADDHDVMRRGLREMLEEHRGWEVCAEARNGRDALDLALALRPDIAVLDVSMPELDGLEVTRRLRGQSPHTEVIIFTQYDSRQYLQEALRSGARGYILKSDAALHLTDAVEAALSHETYLSPGVSNTHPVRVSLPAITPTTAEQVQDKTALSSLTPREQELLPMFAAGKSNRDLASALHISQYTVDKHRTHIMRKLDITSTKELVLFGVRNGLIP